MLAARWHAAGDVRVEEVPEPRAPAAGEALIAVDCAAICGSDLSEYRDGPHMIPVARAHPLTGRTAPLTLGHEWAGRVLEAGDGVDLKPGTRVCGDACIRCQRCFWCLRGEYNICRLGASIGLHADGAFAPYLMAPAYLLEPVPEGVPDAWAALAEPLAVGLHAIRQGTLAVGETVVVAGFGMIGAAACAMALAGGAAAVLVVEPSPARRRLARQMGAAEALDPTAEDVRRAVQSRTEGRGADLVIDCSGQPRAFAKSVEWSRRGGRVAVCGLGHIPAELDLSRLVFFERQVIGVLGYRHDHQAVLGLMAAGRLDPSPLLGDPISLDRIVPDGFERLLADPSAPLRIPVHPAAPASA
jgi:(R,R)-butanediol dehydrogenase / meso-butanediol dehydrogenase / diacetyl reductase